MIKTVQLKKAQEEFSKLVKNASKKKDKYVIALHDSPDVILMSKDEYESLQETLDILSDPEMMKDIREGMKDIAEGRVENWDDVKKELGYDD